MSFDTGGARRCVVVGGGRAGASFERALTSRGWDVVVTAGRRFVDHGPDSETVGRLRTATHVLVAVPDDAIASVARRLAPVVGSAVVVHVSGACGLDVLEPLPAVGSVHPLMSLPDAEIGAARLVDHCNFAVDGDERAIDFVRALGGRSFRVPADRRAVYHAAASVAANHLTALCAQIEALAEIADVPADVYWTLMSTSLENVVDVGAAAALTGPAARGDWGTIERHLAALPADERSLYRAAARRAARVAGHQWPADL